MTTDLDVVIGNESLKMKNGEFKFTPIQNFTLVTLKYKGLVLASANVSHAVNITNVTVPNVVKFTVNCVGNATLTHFNATISCAKSAYFLAPLTNVTINISATGFNNANYSLNTSTLFETEAVITMVAQFEKVNLKLVDSNNASVNQTGFKLTVLG